ncbi:MAG: hypothetical protein ABI867_11875 [Kofleriaceae bacterium]
MANILAIVSKSAFEQDSDLAVGDLYETSEYQSKNKALEAVAEDRGSLFLVTARPGDQLWLVGILEQPIFVGDRWTASANTTRIVDVTDEMERFVFENGKGLTYTPGNLGMTLQAPRRLTPEDVAMLRKAAAPQPAQKKRR